MLKITYGEGDYKEFPVRVFVNGRFLDDFSDVPDRDTVERIYFEMIDEGIL